MLARIGIVLLLLLVLLGVILFSYFRYRTGKAKVGALRLRSAPLSLSEFLLGALRERPGDIVAGLGHVIAALVIFYAVFPGLYEWTGKYFIYPFPWGLLFVAGILAWIGAILHKALKGTYSVLKGLGTVILFFAVVCAIVQSGRLFGAWAGFNIFGSDPHKYTSKFIPVGMTEDHAYEIRVPMREEFHTTDMKLRSGQILKVISITSDGADVSRLSGDGYQGCNARGAIADTGDGVLRNLIAGTEALKYEARLWSLWRKRPSNNPVRTDEIRWNVANPKAPYGAVLFEINGEKRFLEEGEEIVIDGKQVLGFFINLERTKFRLNDSGRPNGAYVVKFVIL